ncbi:hypothetical protein [Lachnoclostridium sp.]|uniref:hypothetical protein n=1 Tax=Lachnoclostridium sp. TaxID=2028282 RepID=UPI0028979500|nr:hypothetical protein [Lachnoclostridium sp.]
MKDFSIQGLGSISGGEFQRLTVEGMGTNHGDIIAEYLSIEGVFKSTGNVNAGEIQCEGVADFFGNLRCKKMIMEGAINLKADSKLEAEDIVGEGCINTKADINVVRIKMHGCVNAKSIHGDQIEIESKVEGYSTFKKFLHKINLSESSKASTIELIKAANIVITGVYAKEVIGHDIIIGPYCEVEKVDCTGTLKVHETAKVGTIVGATPSA